MRPSAVDLGHALQALTDVLVEHDELRATMTAVDTSGGSGRVEGCLCQLVQTYDSATTNRNTVVAVGTGFTMDEAIRACLYDLV